MSRAEGSESSELIGGLGRRLQGAGGTRLRG